MKSTINTIIHAYDMDSSSSEYRELCEKLLEQGTEKFSAFNPDRKTFAAGWIGKELEVGLETAFVFNNQWNTAPLGENEEGRRVFDWAEDVPRWKGDPQRRGHYLEMTEEMVYVRQHQHVCGYCGDRTEDPGHEFCGVCMGSEFLKEGELHLLRLRPVGVDGRVNRAELTEEEAAVLLPRYIEAQTQATGERDRKRAEAVRDAVEEKYAKAIIAASVEHEGMLWLLDNGIPTRNVIYYSHTNTFCFGWRSPLSDSVKAEMAVQLEDFPFAVEYK